MNLLQTAPAKAVRLLANKNYRQYVQLFFRYGNVKRHEAREIRFLQYAVTVPDCLSFIFQFKDIFVRELYQFDCPNISPLIYDCGANIGISCLYFKQLYPKARIKAFEADPAIVEILRSNLLRNSALHVEVIPKAVWIEDSTVSFLQKGADAGAISGDTQGSTRVPSLRLKTCLERELSVDFLKVDIEGAEVSVLQDCGTTLRKVQKLYVEYHSWEEEEQSLDRLLRVLTENNFRYYIDTVSLLERPLDQSHKIFSADVQLNIFAEQLP